jgi:hypothetical protein
MRRERPACIGNPDPGGTKVKALTGEETFDDAQTTEEAQARAVCAKVRDQDPMLNAGKDLAEVLQALEISEATLARWRIQTAG